MNLSHDALRDLMALTELKSDGGILKGVLTSSKPLGTLGMEQYFMVSLTKNCC